jgi:hypothetical protein
VLKVVEEAFDIQIDHIVVFPASFPRLTNRVQRRLAWPVSIRIRVEVPLHFRFQIQFDDHLGDPIPYSGNSELP